MIPAEPIGHHRFVRRMDQFLARSRLRQSKIGRQAQQGKAVGVDAVGILEHVALPRHAEDPLAARVPAEADTEVVQPIGRLAIFAARASGRQRGEDPQGAGLGPEILVGGEYLPLLVQTRQQPAVLAIDGVPQPERHDAVVQFALKILGELSETHLAHGVARSMVRHAFRTPKAGKRYSTMVAGNSMP